MFVIRKEMMAIFEVHMREQFVRKALAQIREVFPDAAQKQGEPQLRALIESGIDKAAGFGVLSEREVLLFVDLMMELGSKFAEEPKYKWIGATLEKSDLNEHQKMDIIYQRLEAASKA